MTLLFLSIRHLSLMICMTEADDFAVPVIRHLSLMICITEADDFAVPVHKTISYV